MPPQTKYRQHKYRPKPGDTHIPRTVRGAYIYNLVNCIQTCLLRRDLDRARRAWAILVRCPDVHWHEYWLWGLYLLTDGADDTLPRFSQHEPGMDGERYLRSLQVAAREADKPVILAELVQHLIRVGRYRAALEELETYLSSFTYMSSAPLLAYAGLVSFYLAQPESARGGNAGSDALEPAKPDLKPDGDQGAETDSSRSRSMSVESVQQHAPPNPEMIRQAREWFAKALEVDPELAVAKEFVRLMDNPAPLSDDEMDLDTEETYGRRFTEHIRPDLSDTDKSRDEGDDDWSKNEYDSSDEESNGRSGRSNHTDVRESNGMRELRLDSFDDRSRRSDSGDWPGSNGFKSVAVDGDDPDADLWRRERPLRRGSSSSY